MKRIPSLDGLRAISILLVVIGHMGKSGHAPRVFWDQYAEIGVRIFFVISGYLITTILLTEHERTGTISLREFYIRRAFRIFPAALVFLLIIIPVFWRQTRWYDMAAALFYVANMDPVRPWVLGHLWSLSIEEQFYLLWPSVLKAWYRHRVAILVGAFLLSPVLRALLYALKVPGGGAFYLPIVGNNLAIGCLLAIFARKIKKIPAYLALAMTAAVALIPLFEPSNVPRTLVMLFVTQPILLISIAGVVLHVVQRPYWILNCAPVVWLGKISYSLYLWQQPFCADPHLRSGYLVVLAFVCAALSYYFVEQPLLRIRERRTPARPRQSAPAVPSANAA
jgi:peptidoglycan/LPS O-acetylase OafA/YrhL